MAGGRVPNFATTQFYHDQMLRRERDPIRGTKHSIASQSGKGQFLNDAGGRDPSKTDQKVNGSLQVHGDIIGPAGITFHYDNNNPGGNTAYPVGSHWVNAGGTANNIEWIYQGGGTWKNIA